MILVEYQHELELEHHLHDAVKKIKNSSETNNINDNTIKYFKL